MTDTERMDALEKWMKSVPCWAAKVRIVLDDYGCMVLSIDADLPNRMGRAGGRSWECRTLREAVDEAMREGV